MEFKEWLKGDEIKNEWFPGQQVFRNYLAYGNPNTKNPAYKAIGFPQMFSHYNLEKSANLASAVKDRLDQAKNTIKVHLFLGFVNTLAATVGYFIGQPALLGANGFLALTDVMAILNQLDMAKRLGKLDKKLVDRATQQMANAQTTLQQDVQQNRQSKDKPPA